jgi:hypothetical protein
MKNKYEKLREKRRNGKQSVNLLFKLALVWASYLVMSRYICKGRSEEEGNIL